MANKRMFCLDIVNSDAFLDMPLSAQALYFHLGMRADDDGFIGNPKSIQRLAGASQDDLMLLITKRFLIAFDNGVIVIKHWRMNNYIQKDRKKDTTYIELLNSLEVKENGSYTEKKRMDTVCIQDVSEMDSQNNIDKISVDKDSIEIDNSCSSVDEASEFFEKIWKEYPNKKGKPQVKASHKKALFKIGYERLVKAIQKYDDGVKDKQYLMYGGRFFTTGYLDYIDEESEVVKDERNSGTGYFENY
jgi:hypothetical protein